MFFRVVKTCNFFGKRRFEFNIRYNNAIKQFRQQDIEIWTAKGLALDDHSELPTSTDQEMIEIVVSQFPEAARELVVLELEAMTRSE